LCGKFLAISNSYKSLRKLRFTFVGFSQRIIVLELLKNNKLTLNQYKRIRTGFNEWLIGRFLLRTFLSLYGNANMPEAEETIFSNNQLDEINRLCNKKKNKIILLYDERIRCIKQN